MLKYIAQGGHASAPVPASQMPSAPGSEATTPVRSALFMGVEPDVTHALQSATAQAERWMADNAAWAEIVSINTALSSPYTAAYVIVWYRSRPAF